MTAAEPDYESLRDHARAVEQAGGLEKPALQSAALEQATRDNIKFTPETVRAILGALQGAHQMTTAAALAGLDVKTVHRWIRQGARDIEDGIDSQWAKFATDCNTALAVCEGRALKVVTDKMQGGPDSFRSATWLLERRFPDRWGKKDKVEVSGDASQPIVVQLTWPGGGNSTDDRELEPAEPEHVPDDDQIVDAVIVDDDNSDSQ